MHLLGELPLAAIGDDLYNMVYLLHLLAVVVGSGAAFMVPVMAAINRSRDDTSGSLYEASRLVVGPSMLLAGMMGAGLVGFSDDVYDFSQTWLSAAFAVWIVILGVVGAVLWPVEKRLATDQVLPADRTKLQKRASMGYGILHLAITVELVIMIWGSS